MTINLVSPVGRLVEGSLSAVNLTDTQGRPRQKPQYYFAIAIAKNDPAVNDFMWQIYQFGLQSYANFPHIRNIAAGLLQQGPQGTFWQALRPKCGFSWKINDGDDPKRADRPGQKGCWIFKYTSTYPFKVVDANGVLIDPTVVKLGWYVDVGTVVNWNKLTDDGAGVFLGATMVRWLFPGFGEEIVTGPSAAQVFAAAPAPQTPPAGAVRSTGGHAQAAPAGQPGYPQAAPAGYPPQANPTPQYAHAAAPAAQAPAMPAGAAYMPAQQGSPTAYPSDPNGYAAHAAPPMATHAPAHVPQHSAGYPPQAGQPGAPIPSHGTATPAYPSSVPGFAHGNPSAPAGGMPSGQ